MAAYSCRHMSLRSVRIAGISGCRRTEIFFVLDEGQQTPHGAVAPLCQSLCRFDLCDPAILRGNLHVPGEILEGPRFLRIRGTDCPDQVVD
jgi:hypothetical protein